MATSISLKTATNDSFDIGSGLDGVDRKNWLRPIPIIRYRRPQWTSHGTPIMKLTLAVCLISLSVGSAVASPGTGETRPMVVSQTTPPDITTGKTVAPGAPLTPEQMKKAKPYPMPSVKGPARTPKTLTSKSGVPGVPGSGAPSGVSPPGTGVPGIGVGPGSGAPLNLPK